LEPDWKIGWFKRLGQGVQVKLWNPLRTCAVPEHLRVVFTSRPYTNPPYLKQLFVLRLSLTGVVWRYCRHCSWNFSGPTSGSRCCRNGTVFIPATKY